MSTITDNYKKAWVYDFLVEVTGKPRSTIQQFFYRNKLDIRNSQHILNYLNNYGRDTQKIHSWTNQSIWG